MKNTLIGAGIMGAMLIGGYTLFNDSQSNRSDQTGPADIQIDNPTKTRTQISTGEDDKDCPDFRTHREAQDFFESEEPGDPHGLDRDGDGQACETLP